MKFACQNAVELFLFKTFAAHGGLAATLFWVESPTTDNEAMNEVMLCDAILAERQPGMEPNASQVIAELTMLQRTSSTFKGRRANELEGGDDA